MNRSTLLLPLLALLVLAGCSDVFGPGEPVYGSGRTISETRPAHGFVGVSLSTVATVQIVQGTNEGVRVEGEDNIVERLRTRVRGGVLEIDADPGVSLQPTRPLRVLVTVRELSRLSLSGSGEIVVGTLLADRLSVTLNGSGEVELADLDSYDLDVRVSGSGTVYAAGIADAQDVAISGSGQYSARYLDSYDARVQVGSSGTATVRVRDRLSASVSGGGSIRYYGNPAVERSGSGTIVRMGS